jgi:energy-converting hydrogenase A subunit M
MAARRKSIAAIYSLHSELRDVEPLIWRRVHVATDIALPKLHDVLQVVMG